VCLGEIGVEPQGFVELDNGVIHLPPSINAMPKIITRPGIVRREPHGGGEGFASFLRPSPVQPSHAEIVLRLRVVRFDPHRFGVKQQGFILLAEVIQGAAQKVAGNKIVRRDFDGVPQKFDAVLPVVQLNAGADQTTGQRQAANQHCHFSPCGRKFKKSFKPHTMRINRPMLGRYSVTVGHGLRTDLHQADGGNERSQKPKPADGQIWILPGAPEEQTRPDCQQQRRANHSHDRPMSRIRVNDGQIRRPKCFGEVTHVGQQGVRHASVEGQGGR
jgi:hypothetical protein